MKICISCGTESNDASRCVRCGNPFMDDDAVNDAETGVRLRPPTTGRPTLLCDRYEIVEEVGRGGMGVVYRARDRERRNVDVALKVLAPELATDPRAVEDLTKEADLAMSLAHPNIISLHNLERDQASGTRFLVMEFIRGESLSHLLERRGPLPAEEAVGLVRQALVGLEYAHRRGVVHRDVKPSNLMRTMDGTVKLGDFGIARQVKDALACITGRGATGTLLYMSPEQLRGERVDARTDIYSMGCVLYELLSGQPPFRTGSIEWQIQNQAPAPISSVSMHLWEVVNRAMAKDRASRFASCAAFGAALEAPSPQVTPPVPEKPKIPTPLPVATPSVPAIGTPATPAAPGSASETNGAKRAHYGLINAARLALLAALVFFGAAKTHESITKQDEYAVAWWAAGGVAFLCFMIAAVVAWVAKRKTGRSIGGTWHPAARIFLLLPALVWLLLAYAKGKAPGSPDSRLLSACLFMGLEILLFYSFFAVRVWKTTVCVLLIAGSIFAVDFRKEIERDVLQGFLKSEKSPEKNSPPTIAPKAEPKSDSTVTLRIPDHPLPPPPKLGVNSFDLPMYFIACAVASVGGGAQGQDLLDLSIVGQERNARTVSVLYQFPQGWYPSSQRATDPSNNFAIRVQASAPFQVTAHLTMADGSGRAITQIVRWR